GAHRAAAEVGHRSAEGGAHAVADGGARPRRLRPARAAPRVVHDLRRVPAALRRGEGVMPSSLRAALLGTWAACALGLTSCWNGPRSFPGYEFDDAACSDRRDNDGDGLTDCF